MADLIEHLEKFCGPIVEGWKNDPDGKAMPFQIVRLNGGPAAESVTYSTLGLSNHLLKSPRSSRLIRLELTMLARRDETQKSLPALLQQVAGEVVMRHVALLRGDVIGPRGALFSGS